MVQGASSAQVLDPCWGEGVDNSLLVSFDRELQKTLFMTITVYA